MSFLHFNQSTFLAQRAIEAEALGPPKPPRHVALPGAKQAIPHDRLLAHQARGHDPHVIVERVNARWRQEHAARLDAHRQWVAGPYEGALEEMRKRAAEEAAAELRRKAAFERWMEEHADAGHS